MSRLQSNISAAVVAWLRANPGEHTATAVAAGLGYPKGSEGAMSVMSACRNLQRRLSVKGRLIDGRTKVYERVIRAAEVADAHRRKREPLPVFTGEPETIDQFLARGGRVEVLPGFEVIKPWAAGIPARHYVGTGARAL